MGVLLARNGEFKPDFTANKPHYWMEIFMLFKEAQNFVSIN